MDEEKNTENLRCEYRQVNRNLRHLNASRLAAIGVFLFVFLIALLFTFSDFRVVWGIGANQRRNASSLWLFITLLFLAFDVYSELNVQRLHKIAKELEKSLNLKQFTELATKERTWLYLVTWAMYVVLVLFWLFAGSKTI